MSLRQECKTLSEKPLHLTSRHCYDKNIHVSGKVFFKLFSLFYQYVFFPALMSLQSDSRKKRVKLYQRKVGSFRSNYSILYFNLWHFWCVFIHYTLLLKKKRTRLLHFCLLKHNFKLTAGLQLFIFSLYISQWWIFSYTIEIKFYHYIFYIYTLLW